MFPGLRGSEYQVTSLRNQLYQVTTLALCSMSPCAARYTIRVHHKGGHRFARSPMRCPGRACLAVCLLLLPSLAAADDDLVIGMSAAFKGPSTGLGVEFYRGARAWFDEVNRTGGVHGRKVRLVAYDDGYDPDPAV